MTSQQAEAAVTISALISGSAYAIRNLVEGEGATAKKSTSLSETATRAVGSGKVLPLGQWLPAMGFSYIAIAIIAAGSPDVGGSLAILIGATSFLGNGVAALNDIGLAKQPAKTVASTTAAPKMEPAVNNHPPTNAPIAA
jgi:hypothetical protein